MSHVRAIPAGYEEDEDSDFEFYMDDPKIRKLKPITIGAGIDAEDFDAFLSKEMDTFFIEYRELWNRSKRNNPIVKQKLMLTLARDAQPLLLALKFVANAPGCGNLQNKNLPNFIFETICELHQQQPEIAASCDNNTRMIAFNFVKTCGIAALYKAVVKTYGLCKISDMLIPKIKELQQLGYYKDAAHWAICLQLTHAFNIYDLVFPLFLQERTGVAEEYLSVATEQQLQIVQYLDSLLEQSETSLTVYDKCDEILRKYKYIGIKHDLLSYRPMVKLVTRLAKKYNIDDCHVPNLKYSKARSHLHYLCYKYMDGGMSCESWRELVPDAAVTKALQIDLIEHVVSYGDYNEAQYWVKFFDITPDECPIRLRNSIVDVELENEDESTNDAGAVAVFSAANNATETTLDNSTEYLELSLHQESIIIVDSKHKFLEMMEYLQMQRIICFDSEWKPSASRNNYLCILQLALDDRVYLVDCLTSNIGDDCWRLLGTHIFNNMEVLKIGFSIAQDLQLLQKSLPLQLNLQACAYLDLRDFWQRLKQFPKTLIFPYGTNIQAGESLNVLAELCLGKKLNKKNQCSNWANRPLRQDQINYAALDAHCLILIYHTLSTVLHSHDEDIDSLVEEVVQAKAAYLSKKLINEK